MRLNALQQIRRGMDLCLGQGLSAPTLTLLFSGIDKMAWLSCGKEEVTRHDFLAWVERYLLPDSGLGCTSIELYSARCGIVHTQSPDARATRDGMARKIFYSWGTGRSEDLQAYIDLADPGGAVALDIGQLVKAFDVAVDRFVGESDQTPALAQDVEQRLQKVFCDVKPGDWPPLPAAATS